MNVVNSDGTNSRYSELWGVNNVLSNEYLMNRGRSKVA